MASKSDKGNSSSKRNLLPKDEEIKKVSGKPKNQDKEDNLDFEDDEKPVKSTKKLASTIKDSDDDIDHLDEESAANTEEVEDDWDPDFDEFDLPKSSKKVLPGKKTAKESEDEFKVDEEFEDFFNSSPKRKYDDDDEDY